MMRSPSPKMAGMPCLTSLHDLYYRNSHCRQYICSQPPRIPLLLPILFFYHRDSSSLSTLFCDVILTSAASSDLAPPEHPLVHNHTSFFVLQASHGQVRVSAQALLDLKRQAVCLSICLSVRPPVFIRSSTPLFQRHMPCHLESPSTVCATSSLFMFRQDSSAQCLIPCSAAALCPLPLPVYLCLLTASAVQRAGRTGRVRPGTVYRLYSEALYAEMPEYGQCEVRR
jgi:hypothetical protein